MTRKITSSATIILLQAFSFAAVAGNESSKPAIITQDREDAYNEDIAIVAKSKGWTTEESLAKRKASDAVGRAAVKLRESHSELFVGSVVSKVPMGAPRLLVKGKAPEDVLEMAKAISEETGVKIVVEDGHLYSFDELEDRKLEVHDALVTAGFRNFALWADLEMADGKIHSIAEINKGESIDELFSLLPKRIREFLELEVSYGDDFALENLYGGMNARDDGSSECSIGWVVENIFQPSQVGVTTAGHCTGINQAQEAEWPNGTNYSISHRNEHTGDWGDIEWKERSSGTYYEATFRANTNSYRDVQGVESRWALSLNESVCVYAAPPHTNERRCSDIRRISVTCNFDDGAVHRGVQMNEHITASGDSGAGFSWGNIAYGSNIGRCGGFSTFSVADLYDEAIGVRVLF